MTDISTANSAQLALLDNYTVQLRASVGEFARLLGKWNALMAAWNANVSGIVGTANNIPVTDSSGLAGRTQLTDTQIYNMMITVNSQVSTYYTPTVQQAMVLFCGPSNMTSS